MVKNKATYRRTIVGLLVNENGEILSVYCTRNNSVSGVKEDKNLWKLPQGGIENNESIYDALFREMKEELGLDLNNQKVLNLDWKTEFSYYFLNEENKPCFEVKLYPFLIYISKKTIINLDNKENSHYDWCMPEEFLRKNLGIRAKAYHNIIQEFYLL